MRCRRLRKSKAEMKAFIPISISTELYSSSRMLDGLSNLSPEYSEYYFLIGDRLQIYNDASDSRKAIETVFSQWSRRPSRIFIERASWVDNLSKRVVRSGIQVKVFSVDDLS